MTVIFNCQPATCDDILPISAPGLKFQCPEETAQYDPSQNKMTPPAEKQCCMVRVQGRQGVLGPRALVGQLQGTTQISWVELSCRQPLALCVCVS